MSPDAIPPGSAVPRAGAEFSGDSYLASHGNDGYRVARYDLDLTYRVRPNRLSAQVTISAVSEHALSRFSMDFASFRIQRVQVDARPAKFTHSQGKLRIRPARPIAAGAEFRVEVRYLGNPRPISTQWGDIGWDELTDGVLVASQPVGAPSWFPCNDHPADKASYRVTVSTDAGYSVLVTGNLLTRTTSGHTATWAYERPEPTSTYLMSVQIGRYEHLSLASVPVPQRAAVPARLRKNFEWDFGRHGRIMEVLERLFGPYPFDEYVVVVTSDELDEPIELQGMSVFGANHVDGRRGYERLAVHELAHQWFGNSLTVADWRHIWLNEGFATYAEWLWSEASGAQTAHSHARNWHARLADKPADLLLADPGVDRMFDERVYKRGALTLHALRCRIGDDPFFALLRQWCQQHRHGTVTTEQFTALAQQHATVSLTDLFAAWLRHTSLPELPRPAR